MFFYEKMCLAIEGEEMGVGCFSSFLGTTRKKGDMNADDVGEEEQGGRMMPHEGES